MSEITPEKTHALLEKLADYVMNEVPTKREMDARFEQVDRHFEQVEQRLDRVKSDVKDTRKDVKLILDGMDTQVKDMEILKTEQMALNAGLSRVEKRVEKSEVST